MAGFTAGVHVVCASLTERADVALVGIIAWSQTMSVAGTTSQAVPAIPSSVFETAAAVDAYYAIGKNPDPVNGPRRLIRGGETQTQFCQPGDYFAWVAA
jgi:hypothetical protein